MHIVCLECFGNLTTEEVRHYIDRCEACERVWLERMKDAGRDEQQPTVH